MSMMMGMMLMNRLMTTLFTLERAQLDLARIITTVKEKVFISGMKGKCSVHALIVEITLSKVYFYYFSTVFFCLFAYFL